MEFDTYEVEGTCVSKPVGSPTVIRSYCCSQMLLPCSAWDC